MHTRHSFACFFFAVAAALALLPPASLAAAAPPTPPVHDLSGVDQYGREIRLSALKGKWVVLNFSAAWSPLSHAMAEDAQPLTDLLRQNHVPFVYLTVVLQNEAKQIATAQTGADWAAQHRITEPVLTPLGANTTISILWQRFFHYSANKTPATNIDVDSWAFPYVAILDPERRPVLINRGALSPQNILTAMGQGNLVYTAPATPAAFTLDGFDLGVEMNYSTPYDTPSAYTGSRAEPTAATGFTTGDLPAALTCDSSVRKDTQFRLARTFTLDHLDAAGLGDGFLSIALKASNLQWGAAGPGFLEGYATTLALRDRFSGETRSFPVPFVATAGGNVTIGPLQSSQIVPDLLFAQSFDRLTFSLQWTTREDPLVSLLALENRLTALSLPPGTASSLIGLLRRARFATAPGSTPGQAVSTLRTLSASLRRLAGLQIDAPQALQLSGLADSVGDYLIAHPPAPPPAVIRAVPATPASGHTQSLFAVGRMAPDFSAASQYGPFRLSQLRGKWVVLDFCTAWCPPCNIMAVNTPDVIATIKDKGIPFEYVTVLLEDENYNAAGPVTAYTWAQINGTRSPIVTPLGKSASILGTMYSAYSLAASNRTMESGPVVPTVVVIDPDGRVASIGDGLATPIEIFKRIKQSSLVLTEHSPPFDLKNYEVDVSYGANTATFDQASLSNADTVLSPIAGSLPSNLKIQRTKLPGRNLVEEHIRLGLDLGSDMPPEIPQDVALSLNLKQLTWDAGGPGYFLNRRSSVSWNSDSAGPYSYEYSTADPRSVDLSYNFQAIGDGLPADYQITSIDLRWEWLREHPDCLLPYLLRHLPELQLTAAQNSALTVPLQSVLRLFQVLHQPHAAVPQLRRFKSLLHGFQSKTPDPQLAESMGTVADLVIQELNAFP